MAAEEVSRTVSAYATFACAYADAQSALPESIQEKIWMFAHLLGDQGRVLEVGSGSGRDAVALEAAGLSVDRTDITPAFVELLHEQGHEARVLDPLVDELAGPDWRGEYDDMWAQACLLHVDREHLGTVLRRLAIATRDKGVLYLSLKEGDDEGWSTHGAVGQPRRFVYWREPQLREVVESAGWAVFQGIEHARHDNGDDWLEVLAYRMPASLPGYRRPDLPDDELRRRGHRGRGDAPARRRSDAGDARGPAGPRRRDAELLAHRLPRSRRAGERFAHDPRAQLREDWQGVRPRAAWPRR